MLYPFLIRFSACSALFLSFALSLDARIGESRSGLESRLVRESGRGLEVSDGDLSAYYLGRSPVAGMTSVLGGLGLDFVVYYKTNDGTIPTSARLWRKDRSGRRSDNPEPTPDGWLLSVLYLNGVSVMEHYQRSKPLTVVETEGLLARNQGKSEWVVGTPPSDDKKAVVPEIFPVNHYRKDFGIYANVRGDTALFFDPRLDILIREKQLEAAEKEAPVSLDGF